MPQHTPSLQHWRCLLLLRSVLTMMQIYDGHLLRFRQDGRPARRPGSRSGGPLALVRTGDWTTWTSRTMPWPSRASAEELAEQAHGACAAPHASRGWTRPPASTCCRPTPARPGLLVGASDHGASRSPPDAAGSVHLYPFGLQVGSTWKTLSCWTGPGPPAARRGGRPSRPDAAASASPPLFQLGSQFLLTEQANLAHLAGRLDQHLRCEHPQPRQPVMNGDAPQVAASRDRPAKLAWSCRFAEPGWTTAY